MPPTDGLDELALMRFRGECGWSSSTATTGVSRTTLYSFMITRGLKPA